MTDKEKIRELIEKRYEYWKEKEFNSHSTESEIRMSECQHLLLMIDSLQEEPENIWHDASEPPIIDKTFLLVAPNGNSSLCLWGGKQLHSVTIGGGHSVLCKGDIYSYIDDLLKLGNPCKIGNNLQEEPVSERFTFKAIPRLLEMIEPTDRAKAYIAKLADTLDVEGYSTDAKIVRESLKIMNGEKVAMATMDKEPVSEDMEEELHSYIKSNFTIDKELLERFGIEEKDYMYSMDKIDMLKMIRHFTNNYKVPASNDLEEAAKLCVSDSLCITNEEDWDDAAVDALDIFKAGAKWQKEKDYKDGLENDNFLTFAYMDGMEEGKKEMREQMIKNSIEVKVRSDKDGLFTTETWDEMNGLLQKIGAKEGDKVYISIIKQEEE